MPTKLGKRQEKEEQGGSKGPYGMGKTGGELWTTAPLVQWSWGIGWAGVKFRTD